MSQARCVVCFFFSVFEVMFVVQSLEGSVSPSFINLEKADHIQCWLSIEFE